MSGKYDDSGDDYSGEGDYDEETVDEKEKVQVGDIQKVEKKDGKWPRHDWIVTNVEEKEQIKDGRKIRKRKITYKHDTGEVTHHCCTIS